MALNFYYKTRLEQLRVIEPSQNLPDINSDLNSSNAPNYENWLLLRLSRAEKNEQVRSLLDNARSYYSRLVITLSILALFCGVVAMASLTANGGSTLNIFWLLGALLGLHTLLLVVWLIFAIVNRNHNNGLISALSHWLFSKAFQVNDPSNVQRLANYTWFSTTFAVPMQKWRLSALSHLWWCCFLCGNLLGLIFIFTTKQFDFAWESTLLKNSDFGAVINVIAAPLQAINITAPIDSIAEQQTLSLSSESRRQWALFILSCLGLYGLLPRILALGFSHLVIAWHQRNWSLDNSLPYYIHLKKLYTDRQKNSHIKDPDRALAQAAATSLNFSTAKPPVNSLWYGLEITKSKPWQAKIPNFSGNINSLSDAQSLVSNGNGQMQPLVVFVEGERSPDRGVTRQLRILNKNPIWFAVTAQSPLSKDKEQNWLQTAHSAGIASEKTILKVLSS